MEYTRKRALAIVIAAILLSSMAIAFGALSTPVKGDAYHTYPIPNTATAANPNGDGYDAYTYGLIQAGLNWAGMDSNITGSAAQGQSLQQGIPTRTLLFQRFHDQIPTHVYIVTAPNPIGIGQADNVVFFNPQVPPNGGLTNTIRYQYTFDVTTPNGTTTTYPTSTPPAYSSWSQNSVQSVNGKLVFQSDSTGSSYMTYTPDTVGNYTFTVHFIQFTYLWNTSYVTGQPSNQGGSNDYYGTTFLASSYTTTLVVQQNPVALTGLNPPAYNTVPTQFWTRPIEQENPAWYAIASNFLRTSHDYNNGGGQNAFQPDGTAPNTGHILWTRPTEDSGILGGSDTTRSGNSFNTGSQYQPRFTTPIIMYGRLYFSPNIYSSGSSELFDCVNLKTGQLIWEQNTTAISNPAASTFAVALGSSATANVPQFGYYYSQDDPNEHGIQNPGWLFTTNYGVGYQPERGIPYLHIAGVPSSSSYFPDLTDQAGAQVRYIAPNMGTSANPSYSNILQWNSSRVIPMVGAGSNPSYLQYQGNVPLTPAPTVVTSAPYTFNGTSFTNTGVTIPKTFTAVGATTPTTVSYAVTWNNIVSGGAWINYTTSSPLNTVLQGGNYILYPSTSSSLTLAGMIAGSTPSYDWNTTLTYNGAPFAFQNTPSIYAGSLSRQVIWGYNGTWPQFSGAPSYAFPTNVTIWEISTAPSSLGKVLYLSNLPIDDPAHNTNYVFEHADADAGANGVFVVMEEPIMTFHIYDMSTGNQLWQSESQAQSISPYNYYTWSSLISQTQTKIAYGMLYTGGYGGSVSAYDINNGTLVWRTAVIPPGVAGNLKSSPAMMALICDGKIYVGSHEHSAETPLEAGNQIKCLNATTGQYIWTMSGWVYPYSIATADGVLIYWNDYDAQIYAVGQGPTSLTVTAPDTATTVGAPVTIRGTVMDVSAGTQQSTVLANFPTGVPAVSDASMSGWMEYVYMQKAMPTNITGVPVQLYVLDSNGNYRSIGTATTDSSGMFTMSWSPDIAGAYKVYASFAGSQSYYGSSAETSFAATNALTPTTAPTQAPASQQQTQMYVLGIGVAIIVILIIIGALILLALRRRP